MIFLLNVLYCIILSGSIFTLDTKPNAVEMLIRSALTYGGQEQKTVN